MTKFKLGNQIYRQNEDFSWSHEPEEPSLFLKSENPKKKDGTLKAKYKDQPRYKLIFQYEDYFREQFNKTLKETQKEIEQYLLNLI